MGDRPPPDLRLRVRFARADQQQRRGTLRRGQPVRWVLVLSYVAWFGGLWRLLAETVGRLLPEVAPTESDRTSLAFATIWSVVVGVVVLALLLRWPWFRDVLRQIYEDSSGSHGRPGPPVGQILRRVAGLSAIVVLPALVLAILLPGLAAAAVVMVVGLVLRVVAVGLSASAA